MTSTPATQPGTADVLEPDVGDDAGVTFRGKGKAKEPSRAGWFARTAVLVLCLAWTIPSVGLLITSFRDPSDITASGWWTVLASPLEVTQWTISNYDTVLFGTDNFAQAFLNSITVALPSTVIPILAAAYAGYAFAWMKFRGRNVLFVMVVALLVVPLHVAFIPMIRIYGQLGINNTFLAVWLAHSAFGMPLAVYIIKNYIGSLPAEVMESAHVDGASHFQIFWRLVMPLSVPVLAAFFIFQFLWTWNDLLVALVFLGTHSDVQVLTVALQNIIGSRGQDWHLLTAGAFLTMTIPLVVFFSLQRYFVRGLTAGSVKG
jgi:alpha-glucoside transport system permease protein